MAEASSRTYRAAWALIALASARFSCASGFPPMGRSGMGKMRAVVISSVVGESESRSSFDGGWTFGIVRFGCARGSYCGLPTGVVLLWSAMLSAVAVCSSPPQQSSFAVRCSPGGVAGTEPATIGAGCSAAIANSAKNGKKQNGAKRGRFMGEEFAASIPTANVRSVNSRGRTAIHIVPQRTKAVQRSAKETVQRDRSIADPGVNRFMVLASASESASIRRGGGVRDKRRLALGRAEIRGFHSRI